MTTARRWIGWAGSHLQALGLSFLTIIFASAVLWFFATFVPDRRVMAIESWRRELSLRADLRRDLLDRRILGETQSLTFVAAFPSVRGLLAQVQPAEPARAEIGHVREILSDFQRIYGQRSVWILDPTGRILAASDDSTPGEASLTLAASVITSGVPRVAMVRQPAGMTGVVCAAPVTGDRIGAGRPPTLGAALIAGDAATLLFDLLDESRIASSSEAFLVEGGADILFLSPLRFRRDPPLSFRLPLATAGLASRAALLERDDFREFVDYRGTRVLAAVRKLKNAPWGLVVKIDEDEALAAFRKDVLVRGVTWSALLVALLAAAVALWHALASTNNLRLARSEARSNLSLAKLWRVVEQSPAAVVITDLGGRIEYVNPRFTEVTGYTAEEALGQNPRILKSDRTPPEVYRSSWETITGGHVWQGELCNRRKDGTLFWESASISPVHDEHGATTSYVAVKEDITDRKRAAEDVAKSEAYFRSLIESGFDLTAVLDTEGRLRYASPSVERILGYRPKELIGRPVFELIHEGDRERAGKRFRQAVAEGIHEAIEVRFCHKDGSWRTLSAIGNGLPVETGMTGLVISARDITDRLQLEAQFRQAQKMEAVGRLAGGVAHDFNNLLTVIQGYGELLKASLVDDTVKQESVSEIVRAAERASALTRQLLAFSRQQVLETRVLDVGAVVSDMEKMLKRLIGEDVEVVVVKPAKLGLVRADPGQIEQVLLNLAVNARDAMPGGGRLTVTLADADLDAPLAAAQDSIPPGRYVVIAMSDTGSGMDAETLGHIFEPFFTTKEKGKGTGLGLATVYGIVRQTGGYVAVESAPGAGTTFRIYLPRCDERMTSGIRRAVPSRPGTETVLLVEDEPAVRGLVQTILERQGYTLFVAESGAAALDIVSRDPRPIHVLLTDLVMPGMKGDELASRIRALRPAVRVVYMSGYAADVAVDLAVDGVSGFLAKPFNERALTAKLREVLDAPPA